MERRHVWRWATNEEKYKQGQPFEISMQGMGLCSFEKKNWPGISQHFRGFGAEEGYIAKIQTERRQKHLLATIKMESQFGRPSGVKYRLVLEDRIYNYFLGWLEMYKDQIIL